MTGEVEARLKEDFGDEMVFEARIRNNIALAKTQQAGIYSPSRKAPMVRRTTKKWGRNF